MPTLHQRFADLAEDAPASPTPPRIWEQGRRRARMRTIGAVAMAAAVLVALAGLDGYAAHRSSSPEYSGQPAAPALPKRIYHPSPWLSGTGDTPPGQLSMLIPGKRGGWPHYHWGMVGVSATTGAYHYLDIPGCLDVDGLSPDGLHVSCFAGVDAGGKQRINGVAIYDTVTGHVDRWVSASGKLALNTLTWDGDDAVLFRADGTSYRWRFGHTSPSVIAAHLTQRVGTAGTAGLYILGGRRFLYLDPSQPDQPVRITLGHDTPRMTTPAAVSPRCRRIVVTSPGIDGRALQVGWVSSTGHVARMGVVPADLIEPQIVGWADEHHILVVNQISGANPRRSVDPAARYDLDSVDIRSGEVTRVAGMSDQQTSWGAIFATSLLAGPTRDFPAPPRPMNQRLELGLAVGFALLGAVGLLFWRRRARA